MKKIVPHSGLSQVKMFEVKWKRQLKHIYRIIYRKHDGITDWNIKNVRLHIIVDGLY